MSSPKDYTAPYGKPAPMYASQSEDYISLEYGGAGQMPLSNSRQQHQYRRQGRYFSTPAKAINSNTETERNIPFYQQNRTRGKNFNNFRKNNRNSDGYQKFKQINNRVDDCVSYFHPTMLEDPWAELMERHIALKQAEKQFVEEAGKTEA